ncbi:DUF4442 domain-containing protein [Catenovulum sp. SM1970]|uniref:DUF4442 domain-containing protein n=1 Tax=Marinifaba aquimaris TaxID=2741323 RepID=UPI001572A11B|nr:DUF4442 domain-containing protein [Marinifaba aquimaris]NTS78383.1 DUF4442 domain-containing protein [Marinifaba aquimaris]
MSDLLKHANKQLTLFALTKVPMIFFCRPKILAINDENIAVKIRLNWFTRNHLKSMYFGTLCIGADLAAGFMVFAKAEQGNHTIHFAFKDMQAEFLKRPESDVYFVCEQGHLIDKQLSRAINTGQRVNQQVNVSAYCGTYEPPHREVVAQFALTLSVRVKPS